MLRFTRHGFREMLIGSIALVIVAIALGWAFSPLALVVVPIFIWLFAFFRDPERAVPSDQHIMVSPADGEVSDIDENIAHDDLIGGPCVRVGIFLSVFNVHVNRAPCDGRVVKVIDKEGKFINAMKHGEASSDNMAKTIVLVEPNGERVVAVVKLIVGMIARRIIFTPSLNETVKRGDRIGMIKFGSRTELYIPKSLNPQIKVKVGQTVHGASDVIAILGNPIHTMVKKIDDSEVEPIIGRESPA